MLYIENPRAVIIILIGRSDCANLCPLREPNCATDCPFSADRCSDSSAVTCCLQKTCGEGKLPGTEIINLADAIGGQVTIKNGKLVINKNALAGKKLVVTWKSVGPNGKTPLKSRLDYKVYTKNSDCTLMGISENSPFRELTPLIISSRQLSGTNTAGAQTTVTISQYWMQEETKKFPPGPCMDTRGSGDGEAFELWCYHNDPAWGGKPCNELIESICFE